MTTNLTRRHPPKIYWQKIKNKILSKDYNLSLAFVGDKEMARVNRKYRKQGRPTNVLSYSLDKKSGEVLIDLPQAAREAKELGKTQKAHVLFLYIHALLHLKGMKHDTPKQLKIMERTEKKWLKILS